MNNLIKAKVTKGSFKFSIKFKIFDIDQTIPIATFDTGCAHSLISVNSLSLKNQSLNVLQHKLLTDIDVMLATGIGIESNSEEVESIKQFIIDINKLKESLKTKGKTKEEAIQIIEDELKTIENNIIEISKNVRYIVKARNYTIEGVNLGDIDVRVSFNTEGKNLIGMHIIQFLYTKIFKLEKNIFLIASLDNKILLDAERKIIEKYSANQDIDTNDDIDIDVLEANYINRKIQMK